MKNPEYQLYWEDIGERLIYAELDDYSWKLAEKMFGYTKQRSMYIYHHGRLAAFYSRADSEQEAKVGFVYYRKKKNVKNVIRMKTEALRVANDFRRRFKKVRLGKLSEQELNELLIEILDVWRYTLSRHFLSQPQFFEKFEKKKALSAQQRTWLKAVAKARFYKTRLAFTVIWKLCRQLFGEYANRLNISVGVAESVRYDELKENKINSAALKKRANKFVMTATVHNIRVYTGKMVDICIQKYERHRRVNQLKGVAGNPGKVVGRAFVVKNENLDFENLPKGMKKGMALIVQNAWPELAQYFGKASAIVTNEGGIISHGVIVAREFGIPCIVGTGIAVKIFKTGDMVEVDAENGIVKKVV